MSSYDLDIKHYSLDEILDLFDIRKKEITIDDLKKAKRKVLQMHPDKSKLPTTYFLFYKEAYEILFHLYEELLKTSKTVPKERTEYLPSTLDDEQIQQNMKKMKSSVFQEQFNRLFDENMKKPISNKNTWFQEEESVDVPKIQNTHQMGEYLQQWKEKNNITVFKEIQPLAFKNGNSLYDEDETEYISSDVFSKLKFDDLRKVHKDQTVFSVREQDINNIPRYTSVDQYQRTRESYIPLEQTKAQKILDEKEAYLQNRMRQKQYESELQTLESIEKNKSVLSSFLRLT